MYLHEARPHRRSSVRSTISCRRAGLQTIPPDPPCSRFAIADLERPRRDRDFSDEENGRLQGRILQPPATRLKPGPNQRIERRSKGLVKSSRIGDRWRRRGRGPPRLACIPAPTAPQPLRPPLREVHAAPKPAPRSVQRLRFGTPAQLQPQPEHSPERVRQGQKAENAGNTMASVMEPQQPERRRKHPRRSPPPSPCQSFTEDTAPAPPGSAR